MSQIKRYGNGTWFNIPDESSNKRMEEAPARIPDAQFTLGVFHIVAHVADKEIVVFWLSLGKLELTNGISSRRPNWN
jgi:hypothetical protein